MHMCIYMRLTCREEGCGETREVSGSECEKVTQELLPLLLCAYKGIFLIPPSVGSSNEYH